MKRVTFLLVAVAAVAGVVAATAPPSGRAEEGAAELFIAMPYDSLRAYELYEIKGRLQDQDLDNWLQAEQEIKSGKPKVPRASAVRVVGLSYVEKASEPPTAIGQRLEGRAAQTTASQSVSGSTKHFNDSLVADPYLAQEPQTQAFSPYELKRPVRVRAANRGWWTPRLF